LQDRRSIHYEANERHVFVSHSHTSRTICGRYDFFPDEFTDLRIRFNLPKDLPLFKPCFNIAPGKDVPVNVRDGNRNAVMPMGSSLVPSWSRDPAIGNLMINAPRKSDHYFGLLYSLRAL
jgi:putative SOS response-associated peptidase YedK